jgi:hypothetical protein
MLLNEETQRYYHYMTWGFGDDAPETVAKYAFLGRCCMNKFRDKRVPR